MRYKTRQLFDVIVCPFAGDEKLLENSEGSIFAEIKMHLPNSFSISIIEAIIIAPNPLCEHLF